MLDEQRFRNLLQRLNCRNDGVFRELVAAYSEPHRAYHNAKHIADCLSQFDRVRHMASHPHEIETAIWFHDAVYDPKASDNEERSAEWAAQVLHDAEPSCIERIESLILATKTHKSDDQDGTLILDIDLSILGGSPSKFALYDDAIRQEYDWVPFEQYREGRIAVLESFQQRKTIYFTNCFHIKYEQQARENLAGAIAKLKAY